MSLHTPLDLVKFLGSVAFPVHSAGPRFCMHGRNQGQLELEELNAKRGF